MDWSITVQGEGAGNEAGALLRMHPDAVVKTSMDGTFADTGVAFTTFLVGFLGDIGALQQDIARACGGEVHAQRVVWE